MFYIDHPLGYVMILAVVLLATKLCGLLFRSLRLPEVLGFIIAGILIGPAIFGQFCGVALIGFENDVQSGLYNALFSLEVNAAGENETVSVFSKVGVILIMFSAGLETNLDEIKNTGLASFLIACAGVAVPFALGFLISLPFGDIGLGTAKQDKYQTGHHDSFRRRHRRRYRHSRFVGGNKHCPFGRRCRSGRV